MNYELNMILNKIRGAYICVYEGESKTFFSKEEFEQNEILKKCTVSSISAREGIIVLELKNFVSPRVKTDGWAAEYEKTTGEKLSFF